MIRGLHNLRPRHRGCVAAIGSFDGVHLGHRVLLDELAGIGAARALPSTLVTFEPQPREFFSGDEAPPRLTRFREKMAALADTPVERVVVLRFDRRFADTDPGRFVEDVLHHRLGARCLVTGEDFRFGRRAAGDVALLERIGERLGFDVQRRRAIDVAGGRVSSSRVRAAIRAGEFGHAARLLGRRYAICGRVAHGRRLGRTIGFPTANVGLRRRVSPVSGVYAVRVHGNGVAAAPGMANVGTRPTVDGTRRLLEVHLFDFEGDLYGRELRVEFVARLRDERPFPSVEALTAQLATDAEAARTALAGSA